MGAQKARQTLDHWIENNVQIDSSEEGDPADFLKEKRRMEVIEWEKAGHLQSLEESALSNRDKRRRKFPKFKREMR